MTQHNPLVTLIEHRAPLPAIEAALGAGAEANDVAVMQALEDIPYNDPWLAQVLALPAMADAWQLRGDADQAALDLSGAIEDGNVDSAAAALATMREAGDTADMLSDDLTFLGEAVACQAPLAIIELLLEHGADPNGFSRDAREELTKLPEDAYRESVERRLGLAATETMRRKAGIRP
ncbi:hypothetical protein [Luteibacter sahnii]|uniref:hypothetical protein n=1 Tax=Luteibacter sahnii TaxID=3021977 RepID=UPI002A6AFFDC|nr:hypothetical protein [Luteibacter sp. PPL193]MDY1549580.1 hypothetical protein [Luteibacter sp. PPL193]